MRLGDGLLRIGPADEQAAYWLRELRDEPTPERHAAFTQWLNASPHHALEFKLAQEVDNRLQRYFHVHRVRVAALVEEAKQRQRRKRRRYRAALLSVAVMLLLAILMR